jgi:hypothetical protein
MDIPADIICAFVGDPTCQLRYTCSRFHQWIGPHTFTATPDMVASAWYSVRVPDTRRNCVRDSRDMGPICPTWNEIIAAEAPFLWLRVDVTVPSGLLLWDRSILPYLAAVPNGTLYKFVLRARGTGTGVVARGDVPGARYAIVGNCVLRYLTRQDNLLPEHAYCSPVLVYERVRFSDLHRAHAADFYAYTRAYKPPTQLLPAEKIIRVGRSSPNIRRLPMSTCMHAVPASMCE